MAPLGLSFLVYLIKRQDLMIPEVVSTFDALSKPFRAPGHKLGILPTGDNRKHLKERGNCLSL